MDPINTLNIFDFFLSDVDFCRIPFYILRKWHAEIQNSFIDLLQIIILCTVIRKNSCKLSAMVLLFSELWNSISETQLKITPHKAIESILNLFQNYS